MLKSPRKIESTLYRLKTNLRFNRSFLILGNILLVAEYSKAESKGLPEWWHPGVSSRLYRRVRGKPKCGLGDGIEHLVVAQHGRFGNMVRQMTNAVVVADKLEIREVLVQSFPLLAPGLHELSNGVKLSVGSSLCSHQGSPERVLAGDFFVFSRLPVPVSIDERRLVAREVGTRLELSNPKQLPAPNDLVIHFRSGDAFNARPHPELGQPPLSFYEAVIEHCRPERVFLVFEDESNPVIRATKDFLSAKSIAVVIQNSTLSEDMAVLLAAETVVASRGSFIESVALVSTSLKKLFAFGHRAGERFREVGVKNVVVLVDKEGIYEQNILQANWANSPSQQQLMLEYKIFR